MRIGVTGSWKERKAKDWPLQGDYEAFKAACAELGVQIAASGSALTVGSDAPFTADCWVTRGYLSGSSNKPAVRVIRPDSGPRPYAELFNRHPEAFVYLTGQSSEWRHTRQLLVSDADALIVIGGAGGSYQAGLELGLTRKPLAPIGSFGGAGMRLHRQLITTMPNKSRAVLETLSGPWSPHVAAQSMRLIGVDGPPKVLLIHGHGEDVVTLKNWLEEKEYARPTVLRDELMPGSAIVEKFEGLAGEVRAAIALATPDDVATALARPDAQAFRARQNVWIEVGWFWGRLGRHRTLLMVKGNLEIPSDLAGVEHVKYADSVREGEASILTFLRGIATGQT